MRYWHLGKLTIEYIIQNLSQVVNNVIMENRNLPVHFNSDLSSSDAL